MGAYYKRDPKMSIFVRRIPLRLITQPLLLVVLILSFSDQCWSETFVVSEPAAVEDLALRDREFAEWNFGGGIVLEVGFMPGLYEEHHCVSLIRFDLSGLPCREVNSAKLRLYKPKCSVQMAPIDVCIYQVADKNSDWTEGSSLCEENPAASCWHQLRKGKSWAGAEGCSKEGVDYLLSVLDVKKANVNRRQWMEFTIPAGIVQQWLDHPEKNSGLYLTSGKESTEWGNHVYFYSSEHASGKGPQLVIEGTPGTPRATGKKKACAKRKHLYPPTDAAFDKWLAEADNRYVHWTQEANMTREQAKMIFYYDVTVRGKMLLPNCRIPLTEDIQRLYRLIPQGDEEAVRAILKDVRKRLLYWEYIREAHWYDAGPLADVLSPLQLGILWGKCIFGKMLNKHAESSWKRLTPDELEDTIRNTVEKTRKQLSLTPGQAKVIDPVVAKCERLEHHYVEKFRNDLDGIQELIRQGADGEKMLNCFKSLHMNHELFLYYQSTFNTPRWTVFMENAPAIPLARMFIKAREDEYNPERTRSQIEHATKYSCH